MKLKFSSILVAGLLAAAFSASPAYAITTSFVTFDPAQGSDITTTAPNGDTNIQVQSASINGAVNAAFSQGPSIYVAVPAIQTINTAPATFDGGVILGLATFFPAIQFASSPNVYGTADFGNGLSNTLTISIANPLVSVTNEVSFALFNGETFNQTYTVTTNFTNGSSSNTSFTNIAPNWQSGYALVDLLFPQLNIASVSINATNGGVPVTNTAWDFLIDDVAFNQSVINALPNYTPPPPAPPVDPVQVVQAQPPQVPEPPQVVEVPPTEFEVKKVENEIEVEADVPNPLFDAVKAAIPKSQGGLCNGSNQPDFCNPTIKGKVPLQIVDNTTVKVFQDNHCRQGLCLKSDTLFAQDVQAVQAVQAVPEPESYAMMLAGLGVMGFVARRRRIVR